MIERNIGNAERIVRLLLAFAFGGWVLLQPSINAGEWVLIALFIMLVLNGIFSRCYLWYLLDVNTHEKPGGAATGKAC